MMPQKEKEPRPKGRGSLWFLNEVRLLAVSSSSDQGEGAETENGHGSRLRSLNARHADVVDVEVGRGLPTVDVQRGGGASSRERASVLSVRRRIRDPAKHGVSAERHVEARSRVRSEE